MGNRLANSTNIEEIKYIQNLRKNLKIQILLCKNTKVLYKYIINFIKNTCHYKFGVSFFLVGY